ncbi:MAG TPA: hypothetical protein PKO23_03420 [Candidatus Hydrogenedentes bacterium]|nr:hypothetical protein [Candidatus Hydrogenedentota bacterium]
MSDYIPRSAGERILWLNRFSSWLLAHGAAHGFTVDEVNAMRDAATVAMDAYTDLEAARAAARAATATKNATLVAAVALAREHAQRIQAWPTTTDADRADAGLTVPDTTPTKTPEDLVLTVPAPLILLDFSVRRQVTVHWGPNPANEQQNGRPRGVIGCQLEYALGGIPDDERAWRVLETDTDSPFIHRVSETAPTTIAYRARYVAKNLKLGPYGDPVACSVTL